MWSVQNIRFLLVSLMLISSFIKSSAQHAVSIESSINIDLQLLIDSLVQEGYTQKMFPGLASAIFWNDSVYYQSIGNASLDTNVPASENVFYQLGSLGKLLSAIAVLQQVDQGKLDLRTDISKYLAVSEGNKNTFNEPITLHCLLTHSCGFNDVNIGYMAKDLDQLMPLVDYINSANPGLFQAPEKDINYSNYSYALAGLIIEKITGSSFESYISENIFNVLGMENSTLNFPAAYEQSVQYAKGYHKLNDEFTEVQIYPRHAIPAGSLVSNTSDMGRFIRALYNQDNRLLSEKSWDLFYTQQFTNHPLLNGYAYGMEQQNINNTATWAKGGMLPGMLSNLLIVPGEFAFFSVINTDDDAFGEYFFKALFDRIHPNKILSKQAVDLGPVTKYTGEYRDKRYNHNNVEKIVSLFRGAFYVNSNATADSLFAFHNGTYHAYIPIGDGVFQNTNLPYENMVFKESEHKTMTLYRNLNIGGLSIPVSYEKTTWYNSPTFVNEYYAIILLIILSGVLFFLTSVSIRVIRIWHKEFLTRFLLPLRFNLAFNAAVIFTIIHTLVGPIHLFKNLQTYLFGYPTSFKISIIIGYLICFMTVWLGFELAEIWKNKHSTMLTRVYVSMVTLALFIHIINLFYWKFI